MRVSNFASAFDSIATLSIAYKRLLYVAWGVTFRAAYPLYCLVDTNIPTAVTAWLTNSTTATTTYGPIDQWDVSSVSNMYGLFAYKPTFNADIGGWNVALVSTMFNMFYQAYAFNHNIAGWNTASVSNMYGMFRDASAFNQPIGKWSVASVSNMEYMFTSAASFAQNVAVWNVKSVTALRGRRCPVFPVLARCAHR